MIRVLRFVSSRPNGSPRPANPQASVAPPPLPLVPRGGGGTGDTLACGSFGEGVGEANSDEGTDTLVL
jgi:hypothetical protein